MSRHTITVEQALARIERDKHYRPQVLELPEDFRSDRTSNAWNDFYQWALGELPGHCPRGLHNGLIAGQGAMRVLLRLRRAQLRYQGERGDRLKFALGWSNMDQGPLQLVGWAEVRGRCVLVLDPEREAPPRSVTAS